jgi:putative membrane protein
MTLDALLAVVHHLAVFGLFAALAVEWGILRPDLTPADVGRLRRYDLGYGIAAGAVLVAGIARVFFGAKAPSFYFENPAFWLKMAAFGAVGGLSVAPTLRYIRWSKRGDAPRASEVEAARRFVVSELVLFALVPTMAALMARGIGS